MKNITISSLAFVLLGISGLTHSATHVIVNSQNSTGSLSREQVARMFMGKIGTFPNGQKVVPFDATEAAVRNKFYKDVTNKSAVQLKAYWSRLIFTGTGNMPKQVATDAEMVATVKGHPAAIGYVSVFPDDRGVKVVLSIE